jgi:uncharacterized protein YeaO (DUF488 family)
MATPGKNRASSTATERLSEGTRAYSSPPCFMHELEPALTRGRSVQIKRIYDERSPSDGYRVLVDRLWPRGIRKQDAAIDDWLRELAPSAQLRKWFDHDPSRWLEFRRRYRAELRQHTSQVNALRQRTAHRRVTLIYSARDTLFNQAAVLKEVLQES